MLRLRSLKHKASVIILAYIFIVVIVILGGTLLSRTVSENVISSRYIEDTQAFWIAEAGLQKALRSFNNNDWSEWTDEGDDKKSLTQNFSSGTYTLTVSGISTANPRVTSVGTSTSLSSSGTSHGIDVLLAYTPNPYFTHAAFGKANVRMSGNGKTDSYDSDLGPYGGSNVGSNGDVGTNGVESGAIQLSGNAKIYGDAATGPEGTVTLSGNAKVYGGTYDNMEKEMASVDVDDDLEALLDNGNYSLGGNNKVTWPAGDYHYTSIGISGNAKLTLQGDTRLYLDSTSTALSVTGNGQLIIAEGAKVEVFVDGKCLISGNGVANEDNRPTNFLLFSTYDGSDNGVQITGNGDLYGAIYAPDTSILISGNGNNYGSIVGKTVTITGNGDVHYDEALGRLSIGTPHYGVKAWLEANAMYPLQ